MGKPLAQKYMYKQIKIKNREFKYVCMTFSTSTIPILFLFENIDTYLHIA